MELLVGLCGYGSIPIHTIFSGMNIHLPAILMFTRGTRVLTHPQFSCSNGLEGRENHNQIRIRGQEQHQDGFPPNVVHVIEAEPRAGEPRMVWWMKMGGVVDVNRTGMNWIIGRNETYNWGAPPCMLGFRLQKRLKIHQFWFWIPSPFIPSIKYLPTNPG